MWRNTFENEYDLIDFLGEIGEYNEFSPKRLISFVNNVEKKFKKIDPRGKIYWTFGREYSPVLYIEFQSFKDMTKILKYLKRIEHPINFLSADEFNVMNKGDSQNLKVRIWWD